VGFHVSLGYLVGADSALLFQTEACVRPEEARKLPYPDMRSIQYFRCPWPDALGSGAILWEAEECEEASMQAADCNFLYFNMGILDAVLAEICARPEEARKLPYLLNAFSDAHSLLGSCSGSAGPSHEVCASSFNDMHASSAWQTDPPLASRLFCQACLAACETCLLPATMYDWLLNGPAKHGLPCLSIVNHAWHDCCRAYSTCIPLMHAVYNDKAREALHIAIFTACKFLKPRA